jgi:hypothetical protein
MCGSSEKWLRPSLSDVGVAIDLESDHGILSNTLRPGKGPEIQLSLSPPAMEFRRHLVSNRRDGFCGGRETLLERGPGAHAPSP